MEYNRTLAQSLRDAFHGIVSAMQLERNFRYEVLIACILFGGMWFAPLTAGERIGIVVASLAVVSAELFNTAIERSVDVATRQYNDIARQAKDTAAAAVLIIVLGAFGYGCFIAWNVGQRIALF